MLAVNHRTVVLSTVVLGITVEEDVGGTVIRSHAQAGARGARAVGHRRRACGAHLPAYLSKLENDAVKKPSPHVLQQLSEALFRTLS